ncbi:MAG: DNA-protecting protein DprA [Pseudopedobacter saltans]|uniref:DNA-protecting protein DprA n=1 Tax=Pseudopedobacter saltans TaxID=151895 RepID=A0A2W5E239_9SPHI|nr:MAG: DNA-protecting protein DprA [Pseudopedobacter saltans]
MELNAKRTVAIVGTRNNSNYGKKITEELVARLKDIDDLLIVSGLAFGIDAIAHNASLSHQIPTVGVLGHGLGSIYPYQHKNMAEKMMENGGILSELFHDVAPDRYNFPKRNRIVAGMTDVTIVIETGKKGGSVITANLANDYNRDVFAVPGRTMDAHSEGCNWLIAQKRAELYFSPEEFVDFMDWGEKTKTKKASQRSLFQDFDENESILVKILEEKEGISIDELVEMSKMSQGRIASVLLNLELKGIVESLPGKRYMLS